VVPPWTLPVVLGSLLLPSSGRLLLPLAGLTLLALHARQAGWHSFGGKFTSGLAASSSATSTFTFGLGTDSRVHQNNGTRAVCPPTFTGWRLAS
jgi:hypothetical protein